MLVFYNCPCGNEDCDCVIDKIISKEKFYMICECLKCGNQYEINMETIKEENIKFIRSDIKFIKSLYGRV